MCNTRTMKAINMKRYMNTNHQVCIDSISFHYGWFDIVLNENEGYHALNMYMYIVIIRALLIEFSKLIVYSFI